MTALGILILTAIAVKAIERILARYIWDLQEEEMQREMQGDE